VKDANDRTDRELPDHEGAMAISAPVRVAHLNQLIAAQKAGGLLR
jgi:hypothetical protein